MHSHESASTSLAPSKLPQSELASIRSQDEYFKSGATRPYEARRLTLLKLKSAIQKNETKLLEALYKDLRKHPNEGYLSEIGILYDEINHVLKGLKGWMKPRRVPTPMSLKPAASYVLAEALGKVLIIAPGIIRCSSLLIRALALLRLGMW